MNLTKENKRQIYLVAGITALSVLAIALAVSFYLSVYKSAETVQEAPSVKYYSDGDITLKPDGGLNIEGVEEGWEIYARYRLYDKERESIIDIRPEEVSLSVTAPGKKEEKLDKNLNYYPLSILPPAEDGNYVFKLEMGDGKEHEIIMDFPAPKEVSLVESEEDPRIDPDTKEERRPFEVSEVDLQEAESIIHINPYGELNNFAPYEEEHLWLPVAKFAREEDGTHMFIMQHNGAWYYALEDF